MEDNNENDSDRYKQNENEPYLYKLAIEYMSLSYEKDNSDTGTKFLEKGLIREFFAHYFSKEKLAKTSPPLEVKYFNSIECLNIYTSNKICSLFYDHCFSEIYDTVIAQILVFIHIKYKGQIRLTYTKHLDDAVRKKVLPHKEIKRFKTDVIRSKRVLEIKNTVQTNYIKQVLDKFSEETNNKSSIGCMWTNPGNKGTVALFKNNTFVSINVVISGTYDFKNKLNMNF